MPISLFFMNRNLLKALQTFWNTAEPQATISNNFQSAMSLIQRMRQITSMNDWAQIKKDINSETIENLKLRLENFYTASRSGINVDSSHVLESFVSKINSTSKKDILI